MKHLLCVLGVVLGLAGSTSAAAQPAGIRGACKLFVERSLIDKRGAPTSASSAPGAWVDNRDGTYSVGARYTSLGQDGQLRGRYTTCIIRESGKEFVLVKLARLL